MTILTSSPDAITGTTLYNARQCSIHTCTVLSYQKPNF